MTVGADTKAKQENSLFSLIKRLDDIVINRHDLGLLIGYSIINRLLDFDTNTGSDEQLRFEEIKAVRNEIERVTSACIEKGSVSTLLDIRPRVESEIEKLIESGEYAGKSGILKGIIPVLSASRKSYEDRIRRNGLRLQTEIYDRGVPKRLRESLESDYAAIDVAFMGGR